MMVAMAAAAAAVMMPKSLSSRRSRVSCGCAEKTYIYVRTTGFLVSRMRRSAVVVWLIFVIKSTTQLLLVEGVVRWLGTSRTVGGTSSLCP